jgi:hypothetical protein
MDVKLRIILVNPPPGIDFALQKGSGSNYEPIQKQRSAAQNPCFDFNVEVKGLRQKDQFPDFRGPFVQGPAGARFIYIDIGSLAGQTEQLAWRLKVPLIGITWETVEEFDSNRGAWLETQVPGTHKKGGPNCATVKPFDGWALKTV